MSSTNKTSLGLNMWEASDKPVRQDFINDNVIINEKITKLNSDIGNGRYTSDLMVPQPFGAVLAWNGNTYNTPYKAGLTLSSEGIALVTGDYSFWQVVLAVPRGDTRIFLHSTNAGIPTGWKSVQLN
ncbi:hypothetical protein [Lacrimispora celerecrescens]|uniref:Uncharacterized protein n=1 Tax=Lacrimispora celerecrescens TaxID=29354 RepID=A0A084JQ48_9FIRM|nr:hypothetical protein [Lacrimispora celerecrescens]KEZ91082.1 hypothetical protein IO98_04805 [Lacrimispora celerecrescens]